MYRYCRFVIKRHCKGINYFFIYDAFPRHFLIYNKDEYRVYKKCTNFVSIFFGINP